MTTNTQHMDPRIEELILACQAPVARLAYRYARHTRAVAFDDLYMTGMTEVCAEAEHACRCTADPLAYLYRVAQYTMIDELKRERQEGPHVSLDAPLSDDGVWDLSSSLATPSPRLAIDDAPSSPVRALSRLPRREREVLVRLYEFCGCNRYVEVGRELGVRCVSTYATRGRQRLRADRELCQAVGVVPEVTRFKKGYAPQGYSAGSAFQEDMEETPVQVTQSDVPTFGIQDNLLTSPIRVIS